MTPPAVQLIMKNASPFQHTTIGFGLHDVVGLPFLGIFSLSNVTFDLRFICGTATVQC